VYKKYLAKRNDELREKHAKKNLSPMKPMMSGLIKESSEEIAELSQPFKNMFGEAVAQVSIGLCQAGVV
jgi:hypothetical protein